MMVAQGRRRCSGALLSVFALALAAPAAAGPASCCDEMAAHAAAHCKGLSSASCCDCSHNVYTAPHAPVPPVSATSAPLPAPPVRLLAAKAEAPARLSELRARLIRSVVLQL